MKMATCSSAWNARTNGRKRQIYSFYKLLKALETTDLWPRSSGRVIDAKIFNRLLNGQIFPGSILEKYQRYDHWSEDFLDIYRQNGGAANYEAWYGKEFLAAQNIVREELEHHRAQF